MGLKAASEMVDIFADLPPGHEIFEQFSFVSESELETLRSIVARAKGGEAALKVADRHALLSLPFKIIVARHRLDVALREEAMQRRIVEARKALAAGLPEETRGQIAFFDPAAYNDAATLQDNILFGKIAYGEADAGTRVPQLVTSVLNDLGLRATVIAVGLDFGVGTGGTRLSLAQRQKAAIARALLKRPSLLILNEATAALDGASQAKVLNRVREACNGSGLIWALHRASFARSFDRVLVMSTGRVVEQGTPAELDAGGATFKVLVGAE
jgi:ABC-type transport system involved in cytochrome bd biosynthesis fused ATPase/permease subunit